MYRIPAMAVKTRVCYHDGCLQGKIGPTLLRLPPVSSYFNDTTASVRIYRLEADVILIADDLRDTPTKSRWLRFIKHAHGILLRRLGKVRVVYLIRTTQESESEPSLWHCNANLVTGVSRKWLDEKFSAVDGQEKKCIVAG